MTFDILVHAGNSQVSHCVPGNCVIHVLELGTDVAMTAKSDPSATQILWLGEWCTGYTPKAHYEQSSRAGDLEDRNAKQFGRSL